MDSKLKKKKLLPLIKIKKSNSFIENPNKGGIPANDKIIIKNTRFSGKRTPNFLKSLRLFIYFISKIFNKKKKVNTRNIYEHKIIIAVIKITSV